MKQFDKCEIRRSLVRRRIVRGWRSGPDDAAKRGSQIKDIINELINTVYYLIMAGAFLWILWGVFDCCITYNFPELVQWPLFGSAIYLVSIVWGEL